MTLNKHERERKEIIERIIGEHDDACRALAKTMERGLAAVRSGEHVRRLAHELNVALATIYESRAELFTEYGELSWRARAGAFGDEKRYAEHEKAIREAEKAASELGVPSARYAKLVREERARVDYAQPLPPTRLADQAPRAKVRRPDDEWEYPPINWRGESLSGDQVRAAIDWYWVSGQAEEDIAGGIMERGDVAAARDASNKEAPGWGGFTSGD